jgi:hypothetical protein
VFTETPVRSPLVYRRVLLADANDLIDEQGRPVGEIRSSEHIRRSVNSAYTMCPYSGSRTRSPYLMNASALEQIVANWPEVLGILKYVRTACMPGERGSPPLLALARVAAAALTLPVYLAYRAPNADIVAWTPTAVAATHKMTAGLFGVCKNYLLSRVAEGENYASVTASEAALFRYAEDSGALLSRTGIEACAGPPKLMTEALRMLVTGHCDTAVRLDMAEQTVGSPARFLAYANATIDLMIWLNVFVPVSRESVVSIRSSLERWCLERSPELVARSCDAADEYSRIGIFDPTLKGLLALPTEACTEYAIGAASLGQHPLFLGLQEALRERRSLCRYKDAGSLLGESALPVSLPQEVLTQIASTMTLERRGLQTFSALQAEVHDALMWDRSTHDAMSTIVSLFGLMPSAYVSRAFGDSSRAMALFDTKESS